MVAASQPPNSATATAGSKQIELGSPLPSQQLLISARTIHQRAVHLPSRSHPRHCRPNALIVFPFKPRHAWTGARTRVPRPLGSDGFRAWAPLSGDRVAERNTKKRRFVCPIVLLYTKCTNVFSRIVRTESSRVGSSSGEHDARYPEPRAR